MKPGFVSAVAVLFCCAVVGLVAVFGYTRYRKAQAEDAAFRAQLIRDSMQNQQQSLGLRLPQQLPARGSTTGGYPTASPGAGQ